MSQKNEEELGDNVFHILVKLNNLNNPEFFIAPSKVVSEQVTKKHKEWLKTPGKNGQVHNDTSMRKFNLDLGSDYKDAWRLLKK